MSEAVQIEDVQVEDVQDALDLLDTEEMSGLPLPLREGLRRYLGGRIATGSFLRACLENDFAAAMIRADPGLWMAQGKLIARFLHGSVPAMAWGSREKVAAWLEGEVG